ncbi:Uncharacterised protein [Mycobacteroides abscessus]|nr:Uncharacterised protein [Mycobacteroides abscessus]
MGIVRVAVGIRTCQCLTCRGRRVPQRVEFGQPVNIGRELVVLPRLGVDGIDLIQCEPEPIRFLRKLRTRLVRSIRSRRAVSHSSRSLR